MKEFLVGFVALWAFLFIIIGIVWMIRTIPIEVFIVIAVVPAMILASYTIGRDILYFRGKK